MVRFKTLAALAVASTFALGTGASAQVLYGTEGNDNAIFLLNTSTGTSSVWFNTATLVDNDVYAIAANDAAGLVYWSDGDDIITATYAGAFVSSVHVSGALTIVFGGLAYDNVNNILYASNNSNNLYTLDLGTGVTTDLGDVAGTSNLAGLDFFSGTLYATNDGTGGSLRKIDPGTLTSELITAYPAGDTDIDGLAVGADTAYFVNDLNAQGIPSYNLGTNSFGPTFNTIYATPGIFSGGAFAPGLIPEPAAAGVLGIAALGVFRRRR